MCNRYSAARKEEIRQMVRELIGVEIGDDWNLAYNIPPKARVPVAIQGAARLMQWGLESPMGLLFQARAETITTKPTWKESAAHRRCVFLADGFFDWETVGRTKRGHYFSLANGRPFAIAGVWMAATEAESERCVMVTNAANDLVAPFNDRMPSILSRDTVRRWLDPAPLTSDEIGRLCQPYDPGMMQQWASPVAANSSRYQDPAAIQPLQREPDLFG